MISTVVTFPLFSIIFFSTRGFFGLQMFPDHRIQDGQNMDGSCRIACQQVFNRIIVAAFLCLLPLASIHGIT